MNNLECGYKGKKVNYHNPRILISQIISVNFVKPFVMNQTSQSNN